MNFGIAQNGSQFSAKEFEDYDNPPTDIILRWPLHNENYKLIRPEVFCPRKDLRLEWEQTCYYLTEPILRIYYKDDLVDIREEVTRDKILEYINEILNCEKIDFLTMQVAYLKKENQKK